jgi:hypothetical protein
MKIIAVYFDDESVDLSAFPAGTKVRITSANGSIVAEGGIALTDPFRVVQMPVGNHTHPVTGTGTVTGITGAPQ